ncbi:MULTISPECIES: hypothetical protein [Haemophilus]|jgi:hypothetical protein|uniref:hypothetical protein n=1 Tax=Haemophilus TaxID=724 RepID=UPI000667F44D|nr:MULTISPECIES: hypothetical protein [Haemophilus]MBS6000437.1 hypothetical protein [Haemophilus haemolyticus]TPH01666.1 hypothetical protein EUX51_07235 [Haemophilus haemolyticus]
MNIDAFITKTRKFYKELQEHTASRYRSWEYCYTQFYEARKNPERANVDNLSLHLAFYLASWGMYRGSSFLLQYDYTIHTSVVKEILKSEYSTLFGLECKELNNEQTSSLLKKLNSEISTIYNPFRLELKETEVTQDISNILVSKVLLGTLGCVPAYDRFFVDAVKKNKVTTGNYNIASLQKLIKFYEEHQEKLENLRSEFLIKYEFDGEEKTLDYPQMKLLDIGFWKIGFDLSKEPK